MSGSIKKCFISRWKYDGWIVEADYSQLEVIWAALLSNDPMMKQDILDGIDSHSQSASWLNPYTYEQIRAGYLAGDKFFETMRKKAKAPRFELQFGAGAKSIAANNKISEAEAQNFIRSYYERYSVLKEWQDSVALAVKASATYQGDRTKTNHLPAKRGVWVSEYTKRRWTFIEEDAPQFLQDRGELTSFSPTKMKNYPIQGSATGDFVPHAVGDVCEALVGQNLIRGCFPINTVHDSIIFDVHNSVLEESIVCIKNTLERVPESMKRWFKDMLDFDVPLHVDVEYGRNWGEMKNWKGVA